ncbi:MAG TPA: hypothetical protein VGQ24_11595 [Gemmatimonadales bacterium]|nr:hypothetical protein [Gemmatimonadales bacterium]
MLRYHPDAMVRAGCLALMLAASACGKKDNAATVETTSGAATATPIHVTDVKVGRTLGADKRLTDETDEFRPADVIYTVVETRGTAPNAVLQARWTYQDGQVVDESSRNISASGDDVTEFHISKPSGWPTGKYKVQILLNGTPVESEDFEVK